jgi:hypothetical protein
MDRRWVKCGHDRVVKKGSVHGMPKHQGKACGDQLTKNPVHDDQKSPLRLKLLAIWRSSRGIAMRRMSRRCQGATQAVLNGVRDDARAHDEKPSPAGPAVMLEVDDMGHDLKNSPESAGAGKLWIVIPDNGLTGHVGIGINARSRNGISDEGKGRGKSMVLMNIRHARKLSRHEQTRDNRDCTPSFAHSSVDCRLHVSNEHRSSPQKV